jgi:hypothetical protein
VFEARGAWACCLTPRWLVDLNDYQFDMSDFETFFGYADANGSALVLRAFRRRSPIVSIHCRFGQVCPIAFSIIIFRLFQSSGIVTLIYTRTIELRAIAILYGITQAVCPSTFWLKPPAFSQLDALR